MLSFKYETSMAFLKSPKVTYCLCLEKCKHCLLIQNNHPVKKNEKNRNFKQNYW